MALAVAGKIALALTTVVLIKVAEENEDWIKEQLQKLLAWVRMTFTRRPVPVLREPTAEEAKLRLDADAADDNGMEALRCPISHKLMLDPVMTPYGHCFEREAIEAWLQRNKTCPITRNPLSVKDLKSCYSMKYAVEQYILLQAKLKKE